MFKLAFIEEFNIPMIVTPNNGFFEIIGIDLGITVDPSIGSFIMDYTKTDSFIPLHKTGIGIDANISSAALIKYYIQKISEYTLSCSYVGSSVNNISESVLSDILRVTFNAVYDIRPKTVQYNTANATFTLNAFNGTYKGMSLYLVSSICTKHTGDINIKSAELIETSAVDMSNQRPVRIGINLAYQNIVLPVASIIGKDIHFYTLTLDMSGVYSESDGIVLTYGNEYNTSGTARTVSNNTTLFRPLKR